MLLHGGFPDTTAQSSGVNITDNTTEQVSDVNENRSTSGTGASCALAYASVEICSLSLKQNSMLVHRKQGLL